MRLLLIPGFGEETSIFDRLYPLLPQDKIFIDNWELLGSTPRHTLNVTNYAYELIDLYRIRPEDVVIGHSMGGWIAWHIKHLANCRAVQIASWTDPQKLITLTRDPQTVYWAVRSGLYLNPITYHFFLWQNYYGKPSSDVYKTVFKRLMRGNKHNVVNQLRLIFNPIYEMPVLAPDLRIHSRADTTVMYPDEPAAEVSGDHFNLWTHPEEVAKPIAELLFTVAVKD